MTVTKILATAAATTVTVTYIETETEDNKAVRKLAEERATQEVRRAVNAWIYSQEEG